MLSQINQAQTSHLLFKIHFSIILLSTLRSLQIVESGKVKYDRCQEISQQMRAFLEINSPCSATGKMGHFMTLVH